MNIFNKKYIILFLAILVLGVFLRFNDYAKIPRHGATFDEFAWTWLGINIIQKGVPMSWSSQPQYKNRQHLIYQGAAFWIVTPYLEHPPLFGLVAGSFGLINGVKDMYDVTLAKMRPLAIILGSFSIIMVFILSREIYGNKVGLISALLYSTVPTVVIGSRIVQNENFLIPFWLLSLYLIIKYLKTGRKRFRNIATVIAGLLSLAKVPWLVAGLSLSMILSYKGKWKDAFLVSGIMMGIFSLFIFYGVYFDRELFINLWKLQLARYDISFAGFFSVFTTPLLIDRFYLDGWILFGWLSICLLSRNIKNNYLIVIPFIAYLAVYIFGIPNEPSHGWYRYPFLPFILISSAVVLQNEMEKISMTSLFFILFVGLTLLSHTWEVAFGFSFTMYRIFIIAAILSVIIPLWRIKMFKQSIILWILLFVVLNIWDIFTYIE